jgi:hypothetical protein
VNTPLLKTTTWLILLPYLLAGGGIAAGPVVICYGEDGHVRFENVLDMCCEGPSVTLSQSMSPSYANSDTLARDDTCGNCVDIPVSTNATISHLTNPLKSHLLIAAWPTVAGSISSKSKVSGDSLVEWQPPGNIALSSLRTVILLT